MGSETIMISTDNSQMPAYFAPAAGDQSKPAIVIVHTIFGVDEELMDVADMLANEGFPACAPNLFWRDADPEPIPGGPDGYGRAIARSKRADHQAGMRAVSDTIENLKAREAGNGKFAVMGFCYGGPFALCSAAELGVDAGIGFHGSYVENFLDRIDKVQCPLSFHYGDNDAVAPMEAVNKIAAAFEPLDDAELYVYPGAEHAYMFPSRGDAHDVEATEQSWERALALLNRI